MPEVSELNEGIRRVWNFVIYVFELLTNTKEKLTSLANVVEKIKMDVLILNSRDDVKIHDSITNLQMEVDGLKEKLKVSHDRLDRHKRIILRLKAKSKKSSSSSSSRRKSSSTRR